MDVKPGELDSLGHSINAGTSGGADIDAVAALHHDGQPAGGAVCDLSLDANGALVLQLPLAVSVRDDAGAICGDQLMVQD